MSRKSVTLIPLFFLVSLCLYFTTGCSSKEETLSTEVQAKELLPELPRRLKENNIWYQLDEKNTLTFYKSDKNKIEIIVNTIMNEILPRRRSFSPATKKYLECYEAFFKENNINYELKFVDGSHWIVLDSDNVNKYRFSTDCYSLTKIEPMLP